MAVGILMGQVLKIATLNLGGERIRIHLPQLVKHLSEADPDVIALQEAVVTEDGTSMIGLLNEHLRFSYTAFHEGHNYSQDYGKGRLSERDVAEGLVILSKKPFSSNKVELPYRRGVDRWPRICVVARFADFTLCNLHLSKHPVSRESEFASLPQADIYAGDFNASPEEMERYGFSPNSYTKEAYTSFPSQKSTLDYVYAQGHNIRSVECRDVGSDHRLLITCIQ